MLHELKTYQHWGDEWHRAGWRVQRHVLTGACRLVRPDGSVAAGRTYDECWHEARRLAPAWRSRRGVILLHALAGTPGLLSGIAGRLGELGYATASVAYPSLIEGMTAHTARAGRIAAAMMQDGVEEISFVGHSLGGLVARDVVPVLACKPSRIVFLGTPNRGSELGRKVHRIPPYDAIFGPSGGDVLSARVSALPIPDAEMLVIAGGNGRFGFNPLLHGDDDGIVAVAETTFPHTAHEFLRVAALHRWLPRNGRAVQATLDFMERTPKAREL